MDPVKRTFYLGRYNCIEQLGTGPVGETYRAKIYGVAGFEKQFAVKRLYPQLSENEAFVARFVQAASAFAALEHPGIARVHEVNAQGAHYYIVVDLVRGLDLRRLLDLLQQRGEALAADAAMTIAVDVAHALEHAHSRTNILPGGVLHLGLTAASVMVTYEGEIKLVDVGLLAALMQPGWSDDDTLTPTLAYLPPEVWRGEGVDARADVFSLGVILHELLGGGRVFFSDRAAALRKAIESGPPPPPPADPRLQQIVTRALEPDAARRFATVEEMRVAVQAILGGRIDRARADLSATVRRLAAPRERRTGAFAAVTLPPAATDLTSPVTATRPPPIPPARPHTWAPPTPKPPIGGSLSPIPVHNTLAGIGPDDQALVPIELIELPGLPTEKAMPTVNGDDAETRRVQRVPAEPRGATPPPIPVAAEATPTLPAETKAAGTRAAETRAAETNAAEAKAAEANAANAGATAAAATTAAGARNGEAATEPSWTPPTLAPPPPSPEPLFAEPAEERPEPVEPAKSSVPGVTLPPARRGGTVAVVAGVVLLATAGALAIHAGLSGGVRSAGAGSGNGEHPPAVAAAPLPTEPARPAPPANPPSIATNPPAEAEPAPVEAKPAEAKPAPVEAKPAAAAGAAKPGAAKPGAAKPAAAKPGAAKPAAVEANAAAKPAPVQANPPVAADGPGVAANAPAVAPSGATFAVESTPDGADVFVDGEPSGTTPAQISVKPGRHALVVLGEGRKMLKRTVDVEPGGRVELPLEPARLPAPIAGDAGLKVRCRTHGELRIFVDGEDSGRTCPNDERISVAPGPHKIGLYSARTGEMHEVEHEVLEGNNSTRVYVKY